MNIMILGCDLYHILNWFFVYSILGWAFESTYVSISGGQLVNRGFLTGPVCPIYGVGGTAIYIILHNFPNNIVVYYFIGLIVATVIEYITSLIMEKLFQTRWWDYSQKPFNIHGRICLGASVAWGFFAVFLMEFIHPFISMIVESYSVEVGRKILIIVIVIFAVDLTISVINAVHLSGKLATLTALYNSATEYISTTRIGAGVENLKGKIDTVVNDSIKETASRYASMLTQVNFFQKRMLRAYPQMKSMIAGGQEHLNRMKTMLKIKFKDFVNKDKKEE